MVLRYRRQEGSGSGGDEEEEGEVRAASWRPLAFYDRQRVACLRVDSTTVRMPFACRSSSSTNGYHSSADARAAAPARASAGPARMEGTACARRAPGGSTRTRTRTSRTRGRGEGRVVLCECNAVFPPAGAALTARRGRAHRQGRRRRRGRRAQGGPPAGRGQGGEVRAASCFVNAMQCFRPPARR